MKVEGIDHVVIIVKDLEEAGKFFADLFGIEFSGPREARQVDARILSSPIGIDLFAPLAPDGPSARTIERRGEGLNALMLKVSNLDQAVDEMQSHGVRLINRSERSALFHPKDLHGVMIELVKS